MDQWNICGHSIAAGEKVLSDSLAAARSTDIPYLIASSASSGEYSYAASLGIPGLLLERGACGYCRQEWIEAYKRDVSLILNYLGIISMSQDTGVCFKKIYYNTIYLKTDEKGLWYPAINENIQVKKGDLLGTIEDFFGNCIKSYAAQEDGVVFYYTAGLAVNPGDLLVAYGLEKSAVKN